MSRSTMEVRLSDLTLLSDIQFEIGRISAAEELIAAIIRALPPEAAEGAKSAVLTLTKTKGSEQTDAGKRFGAANVLQRL